MSTNVAKAVERMESLDKWDVAFEAEQPDHSVGMSGYIAVFFPYDAELDDEITAGRIKTVAEFADASIRIDAERHEREMEIEAMERRIEHSLESPQ